MLETQIEFSIQNLGGLKTTSDFFFCHSCVWNTFLNWGNKNLCHNLDVLIKDLWYCH